MNLRPLLATALTIVVASGPAEAATYIVTYQGTVSSGYDYSGAFGTPDSDLAGLSYEAVYTITDPTPGAVFTDDGTESHIFGGSTFGTTSPISATLTINGIKQAISGNGAGNGIIIDNYGGNPYGFDQIFHRAEQSDGDDSDGSFESSYVASYIYSSQNNFIFTSNYKKSMSYTINNGDYSDGSFSLFHYIGQNVTRNAYGYFTPQSVTVNTGSAVPEPSTWAMMICGFGLIGGALRRRTGIGLFARSETVQA